MQVLSDSGYEKGYSKELGFIPGQVMLLDLKDPKLKVPHVCWNDIIIKKDISFFSGLRKDKAFYFVHSYHFVPENKDHIIATCDYGVEFVCGLMKDNIIATQFHPEKSQKNGLLLLENFVDWKKDKVYVLDII